MDESFDLKKHGVEVRLSNFSTWTLTHHMPKLGALCRLVESSLQAGNTWGSGPSISSRRILTIQTLEASKDLLLLFFDALKNCHIFFMSVKCQGESP